MSRTESRTPVLSELQRDVIECELRRAIEQRLAASCGSDFTELPLEAASGVDGMIERLAAAGRDAPVVVAVLSAGVAAVRAEAEAAGLDTGSLADLEARLAGARTVDTGAPSVLPTDLAGSVIDGLAGVTASVLDRLVEREVGERVRTATTMALKRAGLSDVRLVDADDGTCTISAVGASGESARLVVTSKAVEVDIDDVDDAVGPFDPAAGDVCQRASALADQVHERLAESLSEVGLAAGDVEVIEAPTRGARFGGFAGWLARHRTALPRERSWS